MTTANVSFNPVTTTNGAGSFSVQSDGFIQGSFFDDPAIRYEMAGGVLATTETVPMWGGVPIFENLNAPGSDVLGNTVGRATTLSNITGWTVFNQASNMVTTPQSPVPLASSSMSVNFFRAGSAARIVVPMDPSLVSLEGGLISQQVSWDFNNGVLAPYSATTTVNVTSITASYATNLWTFAVVMAAATTVGAIGDAINISGVTGTGASLINGDQIVTAFTDNQHFSFQIAGGSGAFTAGAQAGTIVLNQPNGALPVKVLQINVGNSKVVVYSATTGFATWNNSGSAALIQI